MFSLLSLRNQLTITALRCSTHCKALLSSRVEISLNQIVKALYSPSSAKKRERGESVSGENSILFIIGARPESVCARDWCLVLRKNEKIKMSD